jgi:uncharacterized protein (DUF2141 family)
MPCLAILAAAWCGLCLASGTSAASELRLVIEGIESSHGTIVAGLYDSARKYDQAVSDSSRVLVNDPKRIVGISLRPTGEVHTLVFPDLTPGEYAVIVFHDENDNGKFDKNALGIPLEGYAISNNARGVLSAPTFQEASVHVDDQAKTIRIALQYPRRLSERP